MEYNVIEARQRVAEIKRVQQFIIKHLGSQNSVGFAMACLVDAATAAAKAASLASDAMHDQAADAAAKSARSAAAAAWDILDAATEAAGLKIPGKMYA